MIIFIIITIICAQPLQAQIPDWIILPVDETVLLTNEIKIMQTVKPDIYFASQKQKEERALSYAEILYGTFENFKANLTIARESENKGYIISYLREKMESYNVGNKTIYNSSFGIDSLETGINFSPQENIQLDLNFIYKYFSKGMASNPVYDIQNKRQFLILPEFKYFFSENSILSASFDYDESNSTIESSTFSYPVKINSLKSILLYKKVWSEINSLSGQIIMFQNSVQHSNERRLNNIGIFKLEDKFAFSRNIVVNLGVASHINKNYEHVLAPLAQLLFILRPLHISLEASKVYDMEYFQRMIMDHYYVKINQDLDPQVDTSYSLSINLQLIENLYFNIRSSYHDIKNFPVLYEDTDRLFFIDNVEIESVRLTTSLNFSSRIFSFKILYRYIPSVVSAQKTVPYLARNGLESTIGFNILDLVLNTSLEYSDIRHYLDHTGEKKKLKSYAALNFEALYFITDNLGIKLEGENILNTHYVEIANYPEPEKIFRTGLYARF
ncbi:MAG: hypothetical protein JW827_08115 [Spirochaetes bacterium]|nr:hypothetical protein [Spirochaetota bacterium]